MKKILAAAILILGALTSCGSTSYMPDLSVVGGSSSSTGSAYSSGGYSGGSYSSGGYSGGTVSVRGYTRSNGTYVAPYTRSAPKSRK